MRFDSDVLDSRDLITELNELRELRDEASDDPNFDGEFSDMYTPEDRDRLNDLEEIEDCVPDWNYGATLIHENYFEHYAREFAEDIGAIDGNESWPATCIDWEKAASELAMDYTSVELGDDTYYVR